MDIFLGAETYSTACNLCSFIQRDIRKTLNEEICPNNYGEEFISIGIIPIIMPEEDHKDFPERRLIKRKSREADIRLYIDYNKFTQGRYSFEDEKYAYIRKLMIVKNIVDSIMVVENQKKADFQGKKLINDILKALNIKYQELEMLNE